MAKEDENEFLRAFRSVEWWLDYTRDVIAQRSLTMEDGRERGSVQAKQEPQVEEKPIVVGGDDGDSLG